MTVIGNGQATAAWIEPAQLRDLDSDCSMTVFTFEDPRSFDEWARVISLALPLCECGSALVDFDGDEGSVMDRIEESVSFWCVDCDEQRCSFERVVRVGSADTDAGLLRSEDAARRRQGSS